MAWRGHWRSSYAGRGNLCRRNQYHARGGRASGDGRTLGGMRVERPRFWTKLILAAVAALASIAPVGGRCVDGGGARTWEGRARRCGGIEGREGGAVGGRERESCEFCRPSLAKPLGAARHQPAVDITRTRPQRPETRPPSPSSPSPPCLPSPGQLAPDSPPPCGPLPPGPSPPEPARTRPTSRSRTTTRRAPTMRPPSSSTTTRSR